MNIQNDKNEKSTRHSSKGIPVLSEYAKSLERRVKWNIFAVAKWRAVGLSF